MSDGEMIEPKVAQPGEDVARLQIAVNEAVAHLMEQGAHDVQIFVGAEIAMTRQNIAISGCAGNSYANRAMVRDWLTMMDARAQERFLK